MIPHEIPTKPWEICATDLSELDKETYIVIADYYSKFFEVKKIASSSSKTVINVLKEIFSRYGIPVILKSDNRPAYSSMEFNDFAKNYGLDLILDLHLSISNGFVSSKIYNKRDDFDFDMVNFPFLDGDVPHSTS